MKKLSVKKLLIPSSKLTLLYRIARLRTKLDAIDYKAYGVRGYNNSLEVIVDEEEVDIFI